MAAEILSGLPHPAVDLDLVAQLLCDPDSLGLVVDHRVQFQLKLLGLWLLGVDLPCVGCLAARLCLYQPLLVLPVLVFRDVDLFFNAL